MNVTVSLSTSLILVGFRPTVLGSSFCIMTNFLMSELKSDNNIHKLIMMQKLGPRTEKLSWAGLCPNSETDFGTIA